MGTPAGPGDHLAGRGIFNEGHTASSGERLVRDDLCAEAIRLGRLLAELPDEPEVMGLLALMLLNESRRASRAGPAGELVPLADQDRSGWDGDLIAEGQDIVRRCLRRNLPGPYQIQAAINAVHSDAPVAAATDWRQIVTLYDQLLVLAPSPVVALNRAVAVAEVDGPAAALDLATASTSTATTCSTPSAPTCSGASAAPPRRPWRTGRPWRAPTTPANGNSWRAAWPRYPPDADAGPTGPPCATPCAPVRSTLAEW